MNTIRAATQVSILARECEAIDRYRDLEAWFTDRSYDDLAALCARLASWHREAYLRRTGTDELLPVDALRASAVPWAGAHGSRSEEFLWRVATPRQLLELALESEESEECAAKLRLALSRLPAPPSSSQTLLRETGSAGGARSARSK